MKTRKELVEEYKQKKTTAGVFQIKNNTTGMVLIEAAPNVDSKWNRHRTELRFGSHRNKKLQIDWSENGEENFTFSILSILEIKEDDQFDVNSELKILQDMVMEELWIPEEMKY